MEYKKKLLVYGGAFNPPHLGHERIFESALGFLKPDRAFIVPSGVSPHKRNGDTPFSDRALMCRTFLKYGEAVRISHVENTKRRKKSYTLKTLRWFKKRYPDSEIFFLLSTDMLCTFKKWHRYRRLLTLCTLVVAGRYDGDGGAISAAADGLRREGAKIVVLERCEPFEVSSTEVRDAVRKGCDPCGLVSDEVAEYIEKRGLYR